MDKPLFAVACKHLENKVEAQTAGDLPNYCGGDSARWAQNVEMFRAEIKEMGI